MNLWRHARPHAGPRGTPSGFGQPATVRYAGFRECSLALTFAAPWAIIGPCRWHWAPSPRDLGRIWDGAFGVGGGFANSSRHVRPHVEHRESVTPRETVVPTGRPDDSPGWSTRRAQLAGAQPWVTDNNTRVPKTPKAWPEMIGVVVVPSRMSPDARGSSGHPLGVLGPLIGRLPRVPRMIVGTHIRGTLGYHGAVPAVLGRVRGSIVDYGRHVDQRATLTTRLVSPRRPRQNEDCSRAGKTHEQHSRGDAL